MKLDVVKSCTRIGNKEVSLIFDITWLFFITFWSLGVNGVNVGKQGVNGVNVVDAGCKLLGKHCTNKHNFL